MTQLRELENHHHEEVTELAVSTLDRFAKSQLEGELVDDLRTVSFRYRPQNCVVQSSSPQDCIHTGLRIVRLSGPVYLYI